MNFVCNECNQYFYRKLGSQPEGSILLYISMGVLKFKVKCDCGSFDTDDATK